MHAKDTDEIRITAWPPQPPSGLQTGEVQQGILLEHLPSGTEIVVCKERSQHQNKALALKALELVLSAEEPAKLLPCPFCGSVDILVYQNAPSSDMRPWAHCVCNECGGATPSINAWNSRV